MTTLTEVRHAGEWLVSEAQGRRSREKVIIDTGNLVAGTVLGKITATGKYVILNTAGADGSQTAVGVLWEAVDATTADKVVAAIVRDAEVNGGEIIYPAGISTPNRDLAIANLALAGIIVR